MGRLQTVADIEAGEIEADAATVAALAKDPHVLVRRRVMYAMAALKAAEQVTVLEAGLFDAESSVRIAAAGALAKVHGPDSAGRVMSALERGGYSQMKMACVEALGAMKEEVLPVLLEGIEAPAYAVREVSARALYCCSMSAITSLPVPGSPVMTTVLSSLATLMVRRRIFCMRRLSATTPGNVSRRRPGLRGVPARCLSARK